MSKRNFILLIIALVVIIIAVFGFLYSQSGTIVPGDNTPGTNFISQFNPFGKSNPATPAVTPGAVVSEDGSGNVAETTQTKLVKVSSMPIAGFTVYMKERLKDVPVVVPTTTVGTPYDFGTVTLKDGSSGEAVKEMQRFLNNTLSLSLELDGILDLEVTGAIKQWQSKNGLVADGIVGSKTKSLMYASVNQKTETGKPTPPPTEFAPALRYVDKATGNIYQTFADKLEERKFSTTVIPKVHEAFFGNQGQTVIMRYLKPDMKTIETFVGNLPKELLGGDTTDNNEIKGTFLPDNVRDISLSPDTLKVFYLFESGDNIIGTTMNLSDGKKVQIFSSPFKEWLSLWSNSKIITLSTKPSASVPGYMYTIDPSIKNLTEALGNVNGLTTLTSPDGKLVLYGDNNQTLSVYHRDSRNSDVLGVKTLPEKCVWGSVSDVVYCAVPKSIETALYPDSWYQGEVSFSDQIWKIDITTGNTTMISDPATELGGEEIDGIKLMLDGGENYLFFVNKKDSYLWKLNLK